VWHRLLDFIEQPLFLAAVGILGGLVGVLIYAPILAICGACIVLAFHRAKVVSGCPKLPVQVPAYVVLSLIVAASLYSLHSLIQRKLSEANISLVNSIREALIKFSAFHRGSG